MRLTAGLILGLSAARIWAADSPAATNKEIAASRKLYNLKCLKCHESHSPKKYSEAVWAEWMVKMSRKAKLTPAQADLIQRYAEVLRAEK
jgi:cytochrome c5